MSLFIEPKIDDVKLSKKLGANCVELHTGKYCNKFNKKKNTSSSYNDLKKSAKYARSIGLDVHAGHGLTYKSAQKISYIDELYFFFYRFIFTLTSIFSR